MSTLLSKDQVKLSELIFVTHFTHVSRHFLFTVENKKNCLGKTFLKMRSQMVKKNRGSVHKTTFKKCENKKKSKQKTMKTLRIFGGFWGQN